MGVDESEVQSCSSSVGSYLSSWMMEVTMRDAANLFSACQGFVGMPTSNLAEDAVGVLRRLTAFVRTNPIFKAAFNCKQLPSVATLSASKQHRFLSFNILFSCDHFSMHFLTL